MTPDEERLMRLADGALSPAEAAVLEAEIAADPAKSAQVARWRAQAAGLREALDLELTEPAPDRLLKVLEPRRTVLAFRPRTPQLRAIAPMAMAAAASLVVGVFVGAAMRPSGGTVVADAGAFTVQGPFGAILDEVPSGVDAKGVRILLTVPTSDGGHCRAFRLADTAGLACAQPQQPWRMVALADAPQGAAGDYQPAAGPPSEVLEAIEARRGGDALGAAEELEVLKARR